jgi:phosphatidylserine decarboxylase
VDGLLARNERLITYIDTWVQRVAVVAVGAYNVGRISAAYDSDWSGTRGVDWVTNRKISGAETRQYDPPRLVGVGDEIMAFHLGSTVVLLFEQEAVELSSALEPGAEVKVGEPIARTVRS